MQVKAMQMQLTRPVQGHPKILTRYWTGATLVLLVIVLESMRTAAEAYDQTLRGCPGTCGNSLIPYPFGIGKSSFTGDNCFLHEGLELICHESILKRPKGNVQFLNITLDGKIDMGFPISQVCRNITPDNLFELQNKIFTISSEDNKFVTVGCDSYGYLNSIHNGTIISSTGCLTRCNSIESVQSMQRGGNCTGIGCCQIDIPHGMTDMSIQAFSYNDFINTSHFNNCSSTFVVKKDMYTFSVDHLSHFPFNNTTIVIDWIVGNETCDKFSNPGSSSPHYSACRKNSYCGNSSTGNGYRCNCKPGYEGNPYLPDGCIDIDECMTEKHTCISPKNCHNTDGNYTCFCHKWQSGNGRKEGGCNVHTMVIIGTPAGFVILFVGAAIPYLIYQKKKLVKLKEKFFQQNGGLILLQKLSTTEKSSRFMQIFTEEELKKATHNFDESSIIGKGGFGTVFKGFLADNRVVAIKKSKIVDDSQKEQFINEVVVLSQINHRNVVRILGCCLETKVPLLVYEFVNNGTLFDLIHTERKVNDTTWKTRVRIAAEAAGALSYLHSEASETIIHRDVKTANILLDDSYTAKVSDFGASILIPLDQTALSTLVQGTFGYLDPEYMQTGQLTEKSDVYSFGAVLIELLTGEKPYSFGKPREKKNLANHFLSNLKEDRLSNVLQVGILNEENEKEIKKVAILAAKCLRLKGEERPSMKEVAMELEMHQLINTKPNQKETDGYLVHETSTKIYEHGDSSSHQEQYDSIGDQVITALNDGR